MEEKVYSNFYSSVIVLNVFQYEMWKKKQTYKTPHILVVSFSYTRWLYR